MHPISAQAPANNNPELSYQATTANAGPGRREFVRDQPDNQLPREKLADYGPAALSDKELLAILLGTGIAGTGVVDLAAQLLDHFGSLGALMRAERQQFKAVRGVGCAGYARIVASMELSRRTVFESIATGDVLSSPLKVKEYLSLQLAGLQHEVFCALFVDNRHRVLEFRVLFSGTIDGARVYPREVVKQCLAVNAAAVIFAHNHPSGIADPSDADISITRKLGDALALIDVRVLDHLIVGQGTQTSLAEHGLI